MLIQSTSVKMLVSSAYRDVCLFDRACGISFINNKNNKDPHIDPWGAPQSLLPKIHCLMKRKQLTSLLSGQYRMSWSTQIWFINIFLKSFSRLLIIKVRRHHRVSSKLLQLLASMKLWQQEGGTIFSNKAITFKSFTGNLLAFQLC